MSGIKETGASILTWRDTLGRIITFRTVTGFESLEFRLPVNNGKLELTVANDLYDPVLSDSIVMPGSENTSVHIKVTFNPRPVLLKEVSVSSRPASIRVNGDTVEFNAARYIEPGLRKVRDLLSRMEGFRVGDDGRIFFHGTELSAILLDGEDLTGRDYRSLSENLASGVVSKVQVLHNYNADRLMKEIERSSDLAINLTLSPELKGKLSGNLLAGVGSSRRYQLDAGLTAIRRKLRTLFFGNLNNIGDSPSEQLSSEALAMGVAKDAESFKELLPEVRSSSIPAPMESPRYVNQNGDGQLKMVNGWSVGRFSKLRSDVAVVNTRLRRQSELNLDGFSGQQSWSTSNRQSISEQDRRIRVNIAIKKDRQQNQVLDLQLGAAAGTEKGSFRMSSSGDITDSLTELVSRPFINAHASWQLTRKFNSGIYLVLKGRAAIRTLKAASDINTGRYNDFFDFRPGELVIRQHIGHEEMFAENGVQMIKNKSRFKRASSIVVKAYRARLSQQLIVDSLQPQGVVYYRDSMIANPVLLQSGIRQSFLWRLTKSDELSLNASAGAAQLMWNNKSGANMTYGVAWSILHRFTMFKSLTFALDLAAEPAGAENYFSGPLLTGNATVNYGLRSGLVLSKHRSATLSYFSANVFRGNQLFVSTSYVRTSGPAVPDQLVMPAYSIVRIVDGNSTTLISTNLNFEHLLKGIGSRISFTLTGSSFTQDFALNSISTRNQLYFVRAGLTLSQSFGKIAIELKGGTDQFSNRQPDGVSRHTTSASAKSFGFYGRWKPGSGFRLAGGYMYHQLAAGAHVNLAQVSTTLKVSKRLALSADLHNLMNERNVRWRKVGPILTSQTDFPLVPAYVLLKITMDF